MLYHHALHGSARVNTNGVDKNSEKEHCKKVTMKVLIAVIAFAGCCTLAGISDMLSLVALTFFIILISQYVGILKYKIEKSKIKRR